MAARNLSPRTRREYRNDLTDLTAFLETRCDIHDAGRVTRTHLEAYLAELDHRGFTGNTRRRKVASIRSFFGFLEDSGSLSYNPARKLIAPERELRQRRVLTEAEYKRLQLAVNHETRDSALIELLLQTG
ncbi:MAG: site-specific integrase, partial [Chloroflexi bacterium]|nr:site-specific integrase [Chloroflexota bacterium]